MRALADAAFEGICLHEHGKILQVNQAFADMFGYPREAMVGMDALAITAPESRELVADQVLRVATDGTSSMSGTPSTRG